jgi:hypothetical protein
MEIKLTGAARDNEPCALTREVEQALLRLLASRELRDTRAQEEVAMTRRTSGHNPRRLVLWILSGDRRRVGGEAPPINRKVSSPSIHSTS